MSGQSDDVAKVVDAIIFSLMNTHDQTALWDHGRRDPDVFRLAVRPHVEKALAAETAKVAELQKEVAGLRYALDMAEAAEDLASQAAYEDTDAHKVDVLKAQCVEVEKMNGVLADQVAELKAKVAELRAALERLMIVADEVYDIDGGIGEAIAKARAILARTGTK